MGISIKAGAKWRKNTHEKYTSTIVLKFDFADFLSWELYVLFSFLSILFLAKLSIVWEWEDTSWGMCGKQKNAMNSFHFD